MVCPNCLSELDLTDVLDTIEEFSYTNSELHPCACVYCGYIFSVDTYNNTAYERDGEQMDAEVEFAINLMRLTYAAVQASYIKNPHEN